MIDLFYNFCTADGLKRMKMKYKKKEKNQIR